MPIRIERRSLAEQVFAHIKRMILSGELPGGHPISEEEIAQEFGVSRTPAREAIRRLEEYGLVTNKRHKVAEVIKIDIAEAEKIAEVRARLESLAGRLLAERATEEDLSVLQNLADECKAHLTAGDVGSTFEKDSCFHLEIAARSGNPYLLELMERLDAKVQLCRLAGCLTIEKITRAVVHEHDEIVAAIARQDTAEAARLLEFHALDAAKITEQE